MHRSLAFVALSAALTGMPACIIIDVGSEGFDGFEEFADDFGDDGFDDFDDGIDSAQIRGDIGPSRGIDSPGRADGWVGEGSFSVEVAATDPNGLQVLSIVDIYGLQLEPGQRSSDVSVTGCAGAGEYDDDYEYDDYTDDAEAVVVECGCQDEGVIDVVVTSRFGDRDAQYGSQQHVTTLRVRHLSAR